MLAPWVIKSISTMLAANFQPNFESSHAFTAEHGRAALNWLEKVREPQVWNLSLEETCELLGGVPKRTFQSWMKKAREGEPVALSRDTMERLSLLLGIYKALKIIAPVGRVDDAVRWFSQINTHPMFMGLSPKDYLLKMKSMIALYQVRRYLDAARG